jgi:hypothetical protein
MTCNLINKYFSICWIITIIMACIFLHNQRCIKENFSSDMRTRDVEDVKGSCYHKEESETYMSEWVMLRQSPMEEEIGRIL